MATVYLRSATGRAILGAPASQLLDFEEYRPAPETVSRAVAELQRRGFQVQAIGITVSVFGPKDLFERECGVAITRTRGRAGNPLLRAWRSSSRVMHIAGLDDIIEGITLAVPAAPL